ncbi:pre-60S ribosomal particles component [Dispira simplex]|nr:pre-60S ribosomal particles component [Dispira simplex]
MKEDLASTFPSEVSVESDASSVASDRASDANSSGDSDMESLTLPTKRKRKPKHTDPEAFAQAMASILGTQLKGSAKAAPILAKNRAADRKLAEEKLEHQAIKTLNNERKKLREKGRVIPDYSNASYEKRLRKVATRGVVKLFNAIRTQQTRGKTAHEVINEDASRRKVAELSKDNFLDLLKTGNTT